MSFMFNPHPYDDMSAINRPELPENTVNKVVCGLPAVTDRIVEDIISVVKSNAGMAMAIEGYACTEWDPVINVLTQKLTLNGIEHHIIDISSSYLPANIIETRLQSYLPEDREIDPVLLFGKIYKDEYESICDADALSDVAEKVKSSKQKKGVVIVYGCGAAMKTLRGFYDSIIFFDLTPKTAVLRAKNGLVKNLGDDRARPFKEMVRRCYYVDFELSGHLRWDLLKTDSIAYYVSGENRTNPIMLTGEAFNEITSSLVRYPFRCKPVYNEGVWGGQFIKKVRDIPENANMKNCAWAFDLIPLEVSLLIQIGETVIDIPYFTFIQKEGKKLMGEKCLERFGGYFPIRFNYDDTFHSSGNMSIQVHPTQEYITEMYDEHGRQDESYYVVTVAHDAKTYLGFTETADVDEFLNTVKESEKNYTPIDYGKYVNAEESKPGKQFLIPAGTIHSSGRNQVVLEIGSLTVGSYTYKLYDYLRPDLDGKPRPIHSRKGEKVLNRNCKSKWVKENLVQGPVQVRKGSDWAEYVVGEHERIYFSLRRLEFTDRIEDDTNGNFHVLVLVDGEQTVVRSLDNPTRFFKQGYLDMVVVPATFGRYEIENLGNHPVVVHKTHLKEDYDA